MTTLPEVQEENKPAPVVEIRLPDGPPPLDAGRDFRHVSEILRKLFQTVNLTTQTRPKL